jgi:hypothetical protein
MKLGADSKVPGLVYVMPGAAKDLVDTAQLQMLHFEILRRAQDDRIR